MMLTKQIEEANLAFDFSKPYTIARVPQNYVDAENLAFRVAYSLRPYVADKLGIECSEVILVVISKNNKVVVLCENSRCRNLLWNFFHVPSIGIAQLYDDVKPELILDKLDRLFA